MNTISAQEIKRRGISAVDEAIKKNVAVHIIKNNSPQYVVLTETRYRELIEIENETYLERIKNSLLDIQEGRTQSFKNASELLKAIEQDDDTL